MRCMALIFLHFAGLRRAFKRNKASAYLRSVSGSAGPEN